MFKKRQSIFSAFILIVVLISSTITRTETEEVQAATTRNLSPTTQFGTTFINDSEGQTWFIDEVEKILNQQAKTLNTINSSDDLNNIFALGLSDKNINGKIPKAIGHLKNLQYLYLSKNNLQSEIPKEFYGLTKLINVDISENGLTGSIDKDIKNLTSLEVLLLHSNNLTGEIPAETTQLTNMVNLDLANNKFEGALPQDLGNLSKMKFFSVANNNLSSTMPLNLSNLTQLKVFIASSNNIRGVVKNTFNENNANIKLIDLSSNAFVGDIDASLLNLYKNGTVIDLESNYLAGDNVSQIKKNNDNFIDSIKGQNKFMFPNKITANVKKAVDISKHFKSFDAETNALKRENLKLSIEDYDIKVDPEKFKDSIEFGLSDKGAFYIKALKPVSCDVTIYIKENENSNNSKATFKFNASLPNADSESIKEDEANLDNKSTDKQQNSDLNNASNEQNKEKEEQAQNLSDATNNDKNSLENTLKYMSGYPDKTFRPDGKITREEFAQILYTIEKGEKVSSDNSFSDVNKDRWSYNAISFAKYKGLMKGYPDGTFKPQSPLTRAEFATAVFNYKKLKTLDTSSSFSDTNNHWALPYLTAVCESKYMSGYPDNTFKPNNNITRAEVVSSINRAVGIQIINKDSSKAINPFKDLSAKHWAFYDILEVIIYKK